MKRASLTHAADDADIIGAITAKTKSFRDAAVVGAQKEGQIVRYDQDQLSSLWVLLQPWSRGSIFRRSRIWLQILVYLFVTCGIAALFYFLVPEPDKINDVAASKLSTYFNMFLPFLFGIYLNNIFTRWWSMRSDGISALNQALNDMSVIMAAQASGPELKEAKHLLLRYGLLSHELIYRAARKTDGDLEDLVSAGALRREEYGLLQECSGASSKAQAIWVWIQVLWDGLYRLRRIPPQVHMAVLEHISAGRTGVKRIFTILSTPLPFAYVHLIAGLVHLNLLILAFQAGICLAKAVGSIAATNSLLRGAHTGNSRMTHLLQQMTRVSANTEACTAISVQIVYLTMVPMLYLGFLELAREISDPFGTDPNDFPRAQIHNVMQDESESIFKMGEQIPPALIGILEEDPNKEKPKDSKMKAGDIV